MGLLNDPDSSAEDMASTINMDSGLASQVLKFSNSSFYGASVACTDVESAIGRLGTKEVYKLVCVGASKDLSSKYLKLYGMDPDRQFENSLISACAMEVLAMNYGYDSSLSYTAGLLCGIGKSIINESAHDHYERVFQFAEYECKDLLQSERELIGFDHALVGAEGLREWKFADDICDAVQYQYNPYEATAGQALAKMMYVSNYIICQVQQYDEQLLVDFEEVPAVIQDLNLDNDNLMDVLGQTEDKYEQLMSEMSFSTSSL